MVILEVVTIVITMVILEVIIPIFVILEAASSSSPIRKF
jgi:hypothetical protein